MPAAWGKIRAAEIAESMKGELISGDPEAVFTGISTDSRRVRPGSLFFALKGDRFDGHDFAATAFDQGAHGVVVEKDRLKSGSGLLTALSNRSSGPGRTLMAVNDTLEALGDLAAWWRRTHRVKVVAVTGSSGKTTTKEMLAAILGIGNRTLKSHGNFNNLIGLPLTLLRLEEDHEIAVVEMGMNRPGEIARLTGIADPDVGVILNVGMAHLEGVLDLDGVARAKTELMEEISPGGLVIVNGDDKALMRRASAFKRNRMTFGLGGQNDVRAVNVNDMGPEGTAFDLVSKEGSWSMRVRLPGLHNLKNALAAAAAALSLGEGIRHIADGLDRFEGVKGRFSPEIIGPGVILVDDTYNSNPSSLRAALDAASSMVLPAGRLIAGLGEMLELGETAVGAHRDAGQRVAASGASALFAMGEHAKEMVEAARMEGMPPGSLKTVTTHGEMVREIGEIMRQGDVVLLKGSRRMGLERVVEGLRGLERDGEVAGRSPGTVTPTHTKAGKN